MSNREELLYCRVHDAARKLLRSVADGPAGTAAMGYLRQTTEALNDYLQHDDEEPRPRSEDRSCAIAVARLHATVEYTNTEAPDAVPRATFEFLESFTDYLIGTPVAYAISVNGRPQIVPPTAPGATPLFAITVLAGVERNQEAPRSAAEILDSTIDKLRDPL